MLRTEQHLARNIDRLPEHEFVEQLCNVVHSGFGLVPFLGSGCSSASGIMMGQQFTDYLAFTIFICVAQDSVLKKAHANAPAIPSRRWDLRQRGWPQHPDQDCVDMARRWLSIKFQELCGRCDVVVYPEEGGVKISGLQMKRPGATPDDLARALNSPLLPPILRGHPCDVDQSSLKRLHAQLDKNALVSGGLLLPNISPTSEDAIIERAIRSLYDWRSTLHFLSELQLVRIDPSSHTLIISEAQPKVIDRFNVHITRGRMPNLTHIMLCHLARPARMRLFLTTNFDELIEDAFTQLGQNIEPISVSIRGELPDPEIVHARDTVLKMHGTLWETRADFSLDESPPTEDKRRFFHYVRGCDPVDGAYSQEERYLPQHLLVCGYSGSDNRCVELIKYVLDCDPRARLFWICYNESDLAKIDALFDEAAYRRRITTVVTERLDLLLYDWYQRLCLCLPPGGGSHQFIHNVPPEESFRPNPIKSRHLAPGAQKIINEFKWLDPEKPRDKGFHDNTTNKLVIVDGPSGLLSASRDAFHELSATYGLNKVWLELEDYASPASVAHELFQIIAIRLGLFQLEHCSMPPSAFEKIEAWGVTKERDKEKWLNEYHLQLEICFQEIKQLCRHFGTRPQSWLIVLYGRNGPGGCSGWNEGNFWDTQTYGNSAPKKLTPSPFTGMLSVLVELGFNVIYIPYSQKRRIRDDEKLKHLINNYDVESKQDIQLFPNYSPKGTVGSDAHVHAPESIEPLCSYRVTNHVGDGSWSVIGDASKTLHSFSRSVVCNLEKEILDGHELDRHAEGRIDQMWDLWVSSQGKTHRRGGCQDQQREEVQNDQRKALQKLRTVVYAASLFRQSRHFSAFLSEAVYRCPARYNKKGIDNDVTRAQQVESWLQDFHAHKVFFRKPGGFAWAYRDMRAGLRWIIHHSDEQDTEHVAGLRPMSEFRCRTHYYIGDWYMRAVLTSGHAVPLMEAVYHFAQAANYALKSRYFAQKQATESDGIAEKTSGFNTDKEKDKLQDYWLKSAFNVIKCLRIGSGTIRFWFDKPTVEAWFDAKGKNELLNLILPKKSSLDTKFKNAVSARFGVGIFEYLKRRLNHEVDLIYKRQESGAGNFRIHDWERYISYAGDSAKSSIVENYEGAGFPEPTWLDEVVEIKVANAGYNFLANRNSQNVFNLKGKASKPSKIHSSVKDFVKQIVSLSCQKDESRVWENVGEEINNHLLVNKGGKGFKKQQDLFCELQLLIEWAFTLTRYAKRLDRLDNLERFNREFDIKEIRKRRKIETRSLWLAACILCSAAQDVASYLDPALWNFTMRETSKALTIYGLALSRLHRFSEAHRRWNEAEAILRHSGVADMQVLCGIIELRRAEGYLLESRLAIQIGKATLRLFDTQDKSKTTKHLEGEVPHCKVGISGDMEDKRKPLYKYLTELAKKLELTSSQEGLKQWISRHCGMSHKGHDSQCERITRRMVRLHLSRIGDAWRSLENAQRLFAGKTHSPRWWSRLYSLQLRCYAEQESGEAVKKLLVQPDQEHDQRVFRTLPFRIRRDIAYHITRLLDRGQVANSEGAHPKLTLLDYALRAYKYRNLEADTAHDAHLKTMIEEMLEKAKVILEKEGKIEVAGKGIEVKNDSIAGFYYIEVRLLFTKLFARQI